MCPESVSAFLFGAVVFMAAVVLAMGVGIAVSLEKSREG